MSTTPAVRRDFTAAKNYPRFDVDRFGRRSGSIETILCRILAPSALWEEAKSVTGDRLVAYLAETPESVTESQGYGEQKERPHKALSFYEEATALLSIHDSLLPTVQSLDKHQSRRVTDILFKSKLVRRLD